MTTPAEAWDQIREYATRAMHALGQKIIVGIDQGIQPSHRRMMRRKIRRYARGR